MSTIVYPRFARVPLNRLREQAQQALSPNIATSEIVAGTYDIGLAPGCCAPSILEGKVIEDGDCIVGDPGPINFNVELATSRRAGE